MRKRYLTESPAQTRKLGKILAKEALKAKPKKGLVIGLEGNLGGGKTTFLQGFAKGLGVKEKILSPTFIIIKKFAVKHRTLNFKHFYHVDCYRIEKPRDISSLGFKEIISNPQNIVAIEWVDRIYKILPKKAIIIKFEFLGKTTRKISLIS